MIYLTDQPSAAPTRKWNAAALTSAVTVAIITGVDAYWPGMGATLSPAITAAITAIAGLVAAYFVRNREV